MKFRDRLINMRRGWIVLYRDGSVYCEDDMVWKDLPSKKNICKVILKWDERFWSLDDKEYYMAPTRREYIDVNLGGVGDSQVHSRTIGYYDMETNERVILRVDEQSGRMSYETQAFGE